MASSDSDIIQIDIAKVLHERAPRYYRWMPRFVVRWVERLICQDELNAILRAMGNHRDVEAAAIALRELGVEVRISGMENVPAKGRYVFASNHPLGGLDGLALISTIGGRYDGQVRFLVNDLLMAVKPLQGVFLPVNKYGRQSRQAATDIEREYAGDCQMLTFPAGLCSRQSRAKAPIEDLAWNKAVVTLATKHRRDVVPIYFEGRNSKCFYRWARWRKRLGIKFNFELVLLPREMVKSRGSVFTIHIGKPVSYTALDASHSHDEAQRLRAMVYDMRDRCASEPQQTRKQ